MLLYLLPVKCAIVMAEKQDIAMNQFPVVTSMKYVYGEKTDSGQAKMDFSVLTANIGISYLDDLNEAYKSLNRGISAILIGESGNSPIEYGLCIHAQRSFKGDVSGSQFILQIASGKLTYIREGYGNGNTILYNDWRQI